ncbi:MAG: LysR family transcriptional regulator [Christensenellaceae bacterium]|jgi:DNA-binding transcriptional LysR family regulator|nr:LysR family transcriptional regulator [Christensenellaceae bacterium]
MPADLDLYSIFCTVARCGSLSHAARELYVSQPAISQSMHRLEYMLGCTLFTRTSRGISLTSEGRMLYSYADKAVSLITAAEDKLHRMRTLQSGGLMIGASDTLCQFFLLPYLEKFHTQYPEVQLQVTNRTTPETVELLKVGKVDIALVNLPVDDTTLCVRDVLRVHDVFVANAQRFAYLKGKPVTINELTHEPLVLLEQASNSRKYLDDFASVCGVTLHPEIELGAHSLLVEFARIGLGIACVTYEFAADAIQSGELFEIELSTPMPSRGIGLISLEGVPLSAAADRFINIVMQTPGEQPAS